MKRLKKQKSHQPQQKQAIRSLHFISENQTAYLQDWTKINQIKQQDIQSSNQLEKERQKLRSGLKNHQKQQKYQRKSTPLLCYHQRLMATRDRLNSLDQNGKKIVEVKVENFANIPHRKTLMKIRRSEVDLYNKNCDNERQYKSLDHEEQNYTEQSHDPRQQRQYRLKQQINQNENANSLSYMQKIRRMSLPWLKQVPKIQRSQPLDPIAQIKAREQARRLNEIIRNKIRRKQTNKYILQKQIQNSAQQVSQNPTLPQNSTNIQINTELRKKVQAECHQLHDKNELRILKSWLEYNRSKKKRSISSLLNEHFENKLMEKKKERQNFMALRNFRAVSALSNTELKLH